MIAKHVPRPSQLAGLGCDFEVGFKHLLVIVVAWPQHYPMLTEGNRRLIVIGRDVADGENRHFNPAEHGFMHFPRQVA